MSLTGFVDERVVFCDMEAKGRMGRDVGKWTLRRGNGLWGVVMEGGASGEGTYWEAAPSWERIVRVAEREGESEQRQGGEGESADPLGWNSDEDKDRDDA